MDKYSDIDIVVFAQLHRVADLVALKRRLGRRIANDSVSLSVYSVASAESMACGGSLFLWHLKLEGRELVSQDSWLKNLLSDLPVYPTERARDDLLTLRTVLRDVQRSLSRSELTVMFEAATLFTVLRNIGNVAMALLGRHTFGRISPILALSDYMGERFPLKRHDIERLMTARLVLSGKMATATVWDRNDLIRASNSVSEVLEFVREIACQP